MKVSSGVVVDLPRFVRDGEKLAAWGYRCAMNYNEDWADKRPAGQIGAVVYTNASMAGYACVAWETKSGTLRARVQEG